MAKTAIHGTRQRIKSRWRRQIRRIQRETTYAFHNRIIFREVMRMFRHNPALHQDGATVHDWIVGMYGRDQLMAVRRELDGQSGVINLIKLLHEIEQRPDVITRRGYLRFSVGQDGWVRGRALRHFRELEAAGTTHIDPAIVRRDREELERRCRDTLQYAQRMVAHRTPARRGFNLRNIDVALSAIEDILKKYYDLLTGYGLEVAPSLLGNWRRPFTVAWRVD